MTTSERSGAYLTIPELAEELRSSESTIRRWIAAGALAAIQLGGPGSAIRIPRARLEATWSEHAADH
jgi:excisionase family DNA binding protein